MKLVLCVTLCLCVGAVEMKVVGNGGICCLPRQFAVEFRMNASFAFGNDTSTLTKHEPARGTLAVDFDALQIRAVAVMSTKLFNDRWTEHHSYLVFDGKNGLLRSVSTQRDNPDRWRCFNQEVRNATNLKGWRCALNEFANQVPSPDEGERYLVPAFNIPFEHDIRLVVDSRTCTPKRAVYDVTYVHMPYRYKSRMRVEAQFQPADFARADFLYDPQAKCGKGPAFVLPSVQGAKHALEMFLALEGQ